MWDLIADGFTEGWEAAWDKTVQKIKDSMKREEGGIERSIRIRVEGEERALDKDWNKFFAEHKKALGVDKSKRGAMDHVEGDHNKAVEKGSAEAFDIIAKSQGDKMYAKANEQLQELKKIVEELKKKRRGGVPIAVAKL
jgi:hypothetical protein